MTDTRTNFDLQKHIEQGVEAIVADTLKATLKNPRESAFMAKFAAASRRASKTRMKLEEEGLHVPGFLIASITSRCNLHCAGCYSRCSNATNDAPPVDQLSDEEWLRIFREAEALGISFILLAGGEPMLRRDVVEAAGKMRNIIFPVFTNGTFLDERCFRLLDECRNLIPVLSIEGGPGVLPHQLPRRRRALPLLPLFRRKRPGRLPAGCHRLSPVPAAPIRGRPQRRACGRLRALRKAGACGGASVKGTASAAEFLPRIQTPGPEAGRGFVCAAK